MQPSTAAPSLHDFTSLTSLSPDQAAELAKMEAAAASAPSAAPPAATPLPEGYRLVEPQPRALLASGHRIPLVGLGTWKAARGEVAAAVGSALRLGYRHIDCARVYGNEHEVGEALEGVLREGVVSRGEVFITSKLWNSDHAPEAVEAAARRSMQDLRVSYLDLYLLHWPVTGNSGDTVQPPLVDTWAAMEALVDKGLVRTIGVSNFSVRKLEALMRGARIKPAVNQVEAHPYWRNEPLRAWCASQGVHVTAYSPLGSPDSASITKRAADVRSPLADPVVAEVAAALGKSPAQVLIRWAVQRGTSVLPKSVKPERIAANLQVTDWDIPADAYDRLSALPYQHRMVDGGFWIGAAGPYRTFEDLWDE